VGPFGPKQETLPMIATKREIQQRELRFDVTKRKQIYINNKIDRNQYCSSTPPLELAINCQIIN
jgi:hypothetical protein